VFLAALGLSRSHHHDLVNRRRISMNAVRVLGYRSYPTSLDDREKAVRAVVRFCRSLDRFIRIPGFFVRELRPECAVIDGERRHIGEYGEVRKRKPDIPQHSGIIVPIRDITGRVTQLKVRLDDESAGKMRPFNCPTAEGSGLPAQCHVPLHPFAATARVRVTEGEIKADIATVETGVVTLGLPSAGAWMLALPILSDLGVKFVVIAYDADASTKKGVAGSLARQALHLTEQGYVVELETWDYRFGKGIDDVLAAGHGNKIRTHRGGDLWVEIANRLRSAGHPGDQQVDARIIVADLLSNTEDDADYVFKADVMAAWVALDGSRYRTGIEPRLEEMLKGKRLTQWRKQVAEERRRVRAERRAQADAEREREEREAVARGEVVLKRGDAVELGMWMLHKLAPKDHKQKPHFDLVVHDEGELHVWNGESGLWEVIDRARQSRLVQRFAGAKVRGSRRPLKVNSTTEAIKLAHDWVQKDGFFAQAPPGIAFTNGVVTIDEEGIQLRSHRADHRARFRFEFDYDSDAYPARFLDAAAEWFEGSHDGLQRLQTCLEFFGLSLLGLAPRFAGVALVLLGPGANGKSTFVEIMAACFPPGSVASVVPHDWRSAQKLAELRGKLLNVVGELPSRDLQETNTFKSVVTGESVQGKIVYQRPFFFTPVAGHAFAANALLGAGDLTHGFFRRFTIVAFERIIAREAQDKRLAQTIIEAERPAVIAWLLRSAEAALKRGRLCEPPPSAAAIKEQWKADSDPVRRFLVENTVDAPTRDVMTTGSQLYELFKDWADRNGHSGRLASNTFGRRVKQVLQEWASARSVDLNGDTRHLLPRLNVLAIVDLQSVLQKGVIETKRCNLYPVRIRPNQPDSDPETTGVGSNDGYEDPFEILAEV